MAAPTYFNENLYTHVQVPRVPVDQYEVESPEGRFERSVQRQFAEANGHLRHEEYHLALTAFRRLAAEILRVADPTLPVVVSPHPGFKIPLDEAMVKPMLELSAGILAANVVAQTTLPGTITPGTTPFGDGVTKALAGVVTSGVQAGAGAGVEVLVDKAVAAAGRENWEQAAAHLVTAIESLGNREAAVRAVLTHDLAIVTEKTGDRPRAIELAKQAAQTLGRTGNKDRQYQAILTGAGLNDRAGNVDAAAGLRTSAERLRTSAGLGPVIVGGSVVAAPGAGSAGTIAGAITSPTFPVVGPIGSLGSLGSIGAAGPIGRISDSTPQDLPRGFAPDSFGTEQPILMATDLPLQAVQAKSVGVLSTSGATTQVAVTAEGLTNLYGQIAITADIGLLMDFIWQPSTFVAYLPHLYFFVIPMAIGDCLAGLGAFEDAIDEYRSTLVYPFMNQNVEAVRLWTRLADTYLAWGDSVYRRAGDNQSGYAAAATIYAKIIRPDGKIDASSPLYQSSRFSSIRTRVRAIAAAIEDPGSLAENPAVITPVVEAHTKLSQIDAGLNYLGIAGDFRPPFTFDYLQSVARMLAEQAERAEQGYISFKSQAENEELRADQLDQQVEVAKASVSLEERSLDEAFAGVGVARESLDYAQAKLDNAEEAENAFDEVRWDLLDLSSLEAWAQASSVDRDDQVKLTITGYSVYESDHKKRNDVLYDLSRKRTRITHDLEADRLDREVENAAAYREIAEAQLDQAQARVSVAAQRVRIAQLQQRHAEENAEFLDLKEFSARTWYELARVNKRLVRRYLDMAIEVGYLMERAYELETGRDLARIRFDYAGPGTAGLLASARLRADIESFSHDLVTSTTSKKAPVKSTVSLADEFPVAFEQLRTGGRCSFDTTLARFERAYPGSFLGRIVAVEVQIVGLTNVGGITGTLRNVGVSRFRDRAGNDRGLVYPTDVLPLSQYEVRNDALVFRFDQKELRLFENCGLETGWFLELPFDANDVDLSNLLDVRMVVYWDSFYDVTLEQNVRAALPATGSASKAYSLATIAPDELFFLQQQGEATIEMLPSDLPYSHAETERTRVRLRLQGENGPLANADVQLTPGGGAAIAVTTDGDGVVDSDLAADLAALIGEPVPDSWALTLDPAAGVTDVQVFVEYAFTYRQAA